MFKKLWPLVLSATALGINSYVIAGILPDIASALHVSQGSVGLGVTTFTAAYALTTSWLPGILTRTGTTRRALLITVAMFIIGSAITAATSSLGVFLAARAVAGVGAGALTALATGAAGAMMPGRRGSAMAMVTFGLSLGTVAGVPIGMLIAGRIGWRATIGLIVALALIGLVAIAVYDTTIPPLTAASEAAADSSAEKHATPVLAGGVVLAFLLGIGSLGLYTYLMPIAADAGHHDLGFALVWAWGIGGVLGSWATGKVLNRINSKRLLLIAPALLTAAFLLLWLTRNPVLWITATVVWGAAGWASVAIGQAAFTSVRPGRSVQIVGWLMAAMYIGSAAGSAAGTLILNGNARAALLPGWALIASTGALIAASALTVALRVPTISADMSIPCPTTKDAPR